MTRPVHILPIALLVACASPSSAPAPTRTSPAIVVAAPSTEPVAPTPERGDPVVAYVEAAELDVAPLARQVRAGEPETAARERYHTIAVDITAAARNAPRAFTAPENVAVAHLGLVLVAVAAHETGMLLALDGDSMPCPARLGGCDSGNAHGLVQVHAEPGHDRAFYLELAANIAARSIRATGGLCWYTGSCGVSNAERDIRAIYEPRWATKPYRDGAP